MYHRTSLPIATSVRKTKIVVIQDQETLNDTTPLPSPVHLAPQSPSSPAIQPLPERRGSRVVTGWTKRRTNKWRSPVLMVLLYIVGVAMSLAHCIFYPKLTGRIVGDSDQQEEKIRFGTVFAFLAQICLGASVWTAYTQWLWRTVKRKEMTVAAWNSAFGADTSVLSLLNFEMLRKLRVGSAMAIFAWSLLLPPFFTPATLFVFGSTDVQLITALMPYPSIANADQAHRFSYSPPIRRGTTQWHDDKSRSFTGPRTIISLIATATSSLGEILTLDLPYNNSAYSADFHGPIVKCETANANEVQLIDEFLRNEMLTPWDTKVETDSTYFGFVPTYNSTGQLTAIWHPRQQTPSRPKNELWMTFLRPTIDELGERVKIRQYQVCRLHDAFYNLNVSQYHGFQKVEKSYTTGDVISFPNDGPNDVSNMTQHAYTAFMWVMCDQLVGKFAWYNETNPNNTTALQAAAQFGVIDSPIQRTSLLGSSDLDAFFEMDEEKELYKDQNSSQIFNLSDQRLRDKALERNETLAVLIEELSFNVTISLMHNSLLTHSIDTTVQLTNDVNRYSYKAFALFVPYALANIFALACILVGIISYINDGVLLGKKVQDIIYAARNSSVHGRSSLSRRTSLGACVDERGFIEIRVVHEEAGTKKQERSGSFFGMIKWRKEESDDEKNVREGEAV